MDEIDDTQTIEGQVALFFLQTLRMKSEQEICSQPTPSLLTYFTNAPSSNSSTLTTSSFLSLGFRRQKNVLQYSSLQTSLTRLCICSAKFFCKIMHLNTFFGFLNSLFELFFYALNCIRKEFLYYPNLLAETHGNTGSFV